MRPRIRIEVPRIGARRPAKLEAVHRASPGHAACPSVRIGGASETELLAQFLPRTEQAR
jgi:hypothetical protein